MVCKFSLAVKRNFGQTIWWCWNEKRKKASAHAVAPKRKPARDGRASSIAHGGPSAASVTPRVSRTRVGIESKCLSLSGVSASVHHTLATLSS